MVYTMLVPHLQFDINKRVDSLKKKEFLDKVETIFSQIMQTGNEHIAISFRELDQYSLQLGRSKNSDYICLINLDIRKGRSQSQKRKLVRSYMNLVTEYFDVETTNQYVTLTDHNGEDFNLYEKSLMDWKKNDKPIDN